MIRIHSTRFCRKLSEGAKYIALCRFRRDARRLSASGALACIAWCSYPARYCRLGGVARFSASHRTFSRGTTKSVALFTPCPLPLVFLLEQSGRCDGYILEGKELEFYQKQLAKKKSK